MTHNRNQHPNPEPEDTPDDVQHITLRLLNAELGGGEASWRRHRPRLRELGLLNKLGCKASAPRRIRAANLKHDWQADAGKVVAQ